MGRQSQAGAPRAAPGLVGSITAMNSMGLVMGVDTLRSGLVNLEQLWCSGNYLESNMLRVFSMHIYLRV